MPDPTASVPAPHAGPPLHAGPAPPTLQGMPRKRSGPAPWPRRAKIAFIGSHGIRKTSALLAFAAEAQRAGRSVELGREVVRDNPLGINEGASGEAQLWILVSQVRQELELARKADILATDRGVMDNFAYYLRSCGGEDRYAVEPLVRRWATTYDLVVRLLPDVALQADGIRSTNDAFRDEVETILDRVLPTLVPGDRLVSVRASEVTSRYDWFSILERLAASVGGAVPAPDLWR
jgi:nicotinamide riboside kinase